MTAAPSVLVFDVNETLIDIEALSPLFQQILGDAGRCANGLATS
jgi:2-haloacid dehalogenase